MKMGMVEQAAYWDGISNGESVMDFLDALDFPNECLDGEGDGFFDDFDASELGPIPSDDALTGLFPVPQANFRANSAPKLKPSETGMFQTQSPVSVLETSASCSRGKAVPIKPDMIVPVRTRTKRTRSAKTNPWLLISPICSTAVDSKKTSAAKKKRERKFSQKLNAMKDARNANWQANDAAADGVVKKCTHCEITKTPQWREGPMGPKTLCNACGVRYRSGRLFPEYRPAASPTFIPSLHSNSHRKVIEMRKKAMGGESEADDSCKKASKKGFQEASNVVYEPPMSPLPEFVPMSSYLFDCI